MGSARDPILALRPTPKTPRSRPTNLESLAALGALCLISARVSRHRGTQTAPAAARIHSTGGRSRPDLKIIAQELILLALGHRSPASYQRTVQDSTVTEAGLTLVTEEVEGLKTSDSTWRCREFAYYKWLQELRVAGCEYVDLAQVKRTRTVFAQFQGPKTRAHVLEWAKFFKPFAGLLAKRALGDHTDKAEHGIISRDTRGFQPINEWHNYNSFWRSVGDSARFNTTHVQLDRGWLPRANIQLEHGFEGVASENAVWSIWPRWIEGALVLCASVHLPAHSFVGILPGRPGFIAEEVPAGVVEGPEPGLYMELGSRVGLLSTISRTKTYAEGNVIVTWEPYADEMSSGHTCFHLVLFTYRAIELCQPLVPWDHMTKCHVEGEIVVESTSENNDVIEARLDSDVWMKSLLRGPHSRKFKIIREKQTQYVHAREAQLEDLRKIDGFEEMTFRFCADLRTYIGNQEAIDRLDKINSEFYLGAPYMHQNVGDFSNQRGCPMKAAEVRRQAGSIWDDWSAITPDCLDDNEENPEGLGCIMNSTMVSELGLERSSSLPTLMPLLQRIRLRLRAIGKRIAHKALPFCLTSST
ncbi:MAG: Translation machinery associated TMA7 [Aureobasidium pullulans]|nr:MAG: Translation machinery associated TMA7 [Aureobasidium pullulans]